MEEELKDMPKALRILAEDIPTQGFDRAMCLRDAAAMIESLVIQRDQLVCDVVKAVGWLRCREKQSANVGARGMAEAYGEAARELESANEFIKENAKEHPPR